MQDNRSKPTPGSCDSGESSESARDSPPAKCERGCVSETLATLPIDMDLVADPVVKHAMQVLLNLVERLTAQVAALREENQRLRDENNRLKGEQGKPDVKASTRGRDVSSEKERRSREKQKRRKKRKAKRNKITVHQTKVCGVDKQGLPGDAVFKGYRSVVVQDLEIAPKNTEFKKEVYYSPSLKKSFTATPVRAGRTSKGA